MASARPLSILISNASSPEKLTRNSVTRMPASTAGLTAMKGKLSLSSGISQPSVSSNFRLLGPATAMVE